MGAADTKRAAYKFAKQPHMGQQITTIAEEFATNERNVSQIVSSSHTSKKREASDGFNQNSSNGGGPRRNSVDERREINGDITPLNSFKKDNIMKEDSSPSVRETSSDDDLISNVSDAPQHCNLNVQVPDALYISDNSSKLNNQVESDN